jgi:hypothetical protein
MLRRNKIFMHSVSVSVSASQGVDQVLIAENTTLQHCGLNKKKFSFKYPSSYKINVLTGFHITVL